MPWPPATAPRRRPPPCAACRLMDKAASKGVIHKNQAANRKSGIMALANTVVTDADRAAYVKPEKKEQKTGSKKAERKAARKAEMEAASKEKAKRRCRPAAKRRPRRSARPGTAVAAKAEADGRCRRRRRRGRRIARHAGIVGRSWRMSRVERPRAPGPFHVRCACGARDPHRPPGPFRHESRGDGALPAAGAADLGAPPAARIGRRRTIWRFGNT